MKVFKVRIIEKNSKHNSVYFLQAQVRSFYFFKIWKRIAIHSNNSFGFYNNLDISTDNFSDILKLKSNFIDWYEMIISDFRVYETYNLEA